MIGRLLVLILLGAQLAGSPIGAQPEVVFDEVCNLVRDEFYDPDLHGLDWDGVSDEFGPAAAAAESQAELSAVINRALDRLGASHTRHFHPGEARFYELLDIFNPDGLDEGEHPSLPADRVSYVGIGVATAKHNGRVFVSEVYATGPAAEAGVLTGDEIVSVDGEPWRGVASFQDREAEDVPIRIRREHDDAETMEIVVRPRRILPRELFLADLRATATVEERRGSLVAYVRVLSYAHPDYQDAVMEHVLKYADADAFVLDIRGGWGGANPEYLAIRNPLVPEFGLKLRGEEWRSFQPAWHKPFVLLIDGGSRSGKELFAYALKQHGAATLVGERTAGAVLGGRPFILSDGSVLYLAVGDARVDGDVRLEGAGVAPDIDVGRRLPYSAGADHQREVALLRAGAEAAAGN